MNVYQKRLDILDEITRLSKAHPHSNNKCNGCDLCDQIRLLGIEYETLNKHERNRRKGISMENETPIAESISFHFSEEELKIIEGNGLTRDRVRTRILREGWSREKAINTPITRMSPDEATKYRKLAKENGVAMATFYYRIKKGMSPEMAATTKAKNTRRIV
ncbi:hypothetical protein [Bacillus niameyensis]|uniref:hypothetical protein n=1 Tax=Bacillus niameyensis TaxID=1522308 RepID=UPI00078022F0|nr:hypothetical protein [Bacillus niameyensis]